MPRRDDQDNWDRRDGIILRRLFDPVEERFPDAFSLSFSQTLEQERDQELIIASKRDGFTPIRVKQLIEIEVDKPADQFPESSIRVGLDRGNDCTKEFGKIACSQR